MHSVCRKPKSRMVEGFWFIRIPYDIQTLFNVEGGLVVGKILRFKTNRDHVVEAFEDLLHRAKEGQIEGFVFAADLNDGSVATAWCNKELMERAYLLTHLQADVTFGVIEANIDRLIEYV